MKVIKATITAAMLMAALAVQAIPTQIGTITHVALGNSGDETVVNWLNSVANTDFEADDTVHVASLSMPLDVSGFSYLVLHYGGMRGGNYYIWDLDGADSMTLPTQALSWARLFGDSGTDVPDAGTTLVLLGAGVIGIGAMRRRLSK